MPLLHTVYFTDNGYTKELQVIGSGDVNDEWFVKRVFREAGVDRSLKKFDESKYKIVVKSSHPIKGF